MPLPVSSTRAHRQEVKIILYSLWYHHTYRCDEFSASSWLILRQIYCKLVITIAWNKQNKLFNKAA